MKWWEVIYKDEKIKEVKMIAWIDDVSKFKKRFEREHPECTIKKIHPCKKYKSEIRGKVNIWNKKCLKLKWKNQENLHQRILKTVLMV